MQVDVRLIIAALDVAIADQRSNVDGPDDDYELGYLDGLVRALDIIQTKAHGLMSASERK